MTDEMPVEAVARALDPELWDYAGPDDWNGARERARHRASRALSALPPEMRAAGEMKRALKRWLEFDGQCDYVDGAPPERCPGLDRVEALMCHTCEARAALAALPPEMRAAGEMKRALARYMNAVSDLHGHFDWESGYGRTRGPVDEEFDAATEEARAALAKALEP